MIQRIAKTFLSARLFNRLKRESQSWLIRCVECDAERSVWSCGGLRLAATSEGKMTMANCSECAGLVAALVYQRDADTEPILPSDA